MLFFLAIFWDLKKAKKSHKRAAQALRVPGG
jgi:hypothetical protein